MGGALFFEYNNGGGLAAHTHTHGTEKIQILIATGATHSHNYYDRIHYSLNYRRVNIWLDAFFALCARPSGIAQLPNI